MPEERELGVDGGLAQAVQSALATLIATAILISPIAVVVLLVRRRTTAARPADRASDVPSSPTGSLPPPTGPVRGVPEGSTPDLVVTAAGARTASRESTVDRWRHLGAMLRPRYGTPRSRRIVGWSAVAVLLGPIIVSTLADGLPTAPIGRPSDGNAADGSAEGAAQGRSPGFETANNDRGPSLDTPGPAADWALLEDAGGLSLRAPAGWALDPAGAAAVRDRSGSSSTSQDIGLVAVRSATTSLVIWPLFIPGAGTPPDPTSLLDQLGPRIIGTPTRQLPASEPSGPLSASARRSDPDGDLLAAVAMSPSPAGVAATVYAVTSADLDADAEVVAGILSSIRISGAPAGGASALRTTRIVEAEEGAFSVEVPADWSSRAYLSRLSGTDFRPTVLLRSPDQRISIAWSAVNGTPVFPNYAVTGLIIHPEGVSVGAIDGSERIIRNVQSAATMAQESLRPFQEFSGCGSAEPTGTTPRPDIAQVIASGWSAWAVAANYDAAEVAFRCGDGVGTSLVVTEVMGYAGFDPTIATQMKLWSVKQNVAFVAPPDAQAVAEQVIARLHSSFMFDTGWYSRQLGLQSGLSDIVARAGQEMSEIVSRGYEDRQDGLDSLSQRRSDAILGVERVRDRTTGAEYSVEAGSTYYWVDDRGTVVGTDVSTAPTVDFRALVRGD